MNWIVQGLDRSTGEPRVTNVSAATETEAVKLASQEGVVTQHVQPIIASPIKMHGGWAMFRDGNTRERYLFVLIWSCRIGGIALFLTGLWLFQKLVFNNEDLFLESFEQKLAYWVMMLGLAGVGAAITITGEVASEIFAVKRLRSQRDDSR